MKFRTACLRLVALVGSVGFTPVAFAMPNGLPHAQQLAKSGAGVEGVRWICNPWGRCRCRPTSMARTPSIRRRRLFTSPGAAGHQGWHRHWW